MSGVYPKDRRNGLADVFNNDLNNIPNVNDKVGLDNKGKTIYHDSPD